MVNIAGEAVVCDFGCSRIRHEITRTWTTPNDGGAGRYLAPELSIGPEPFRIERTSDIYSMGMTFFALSTQSFPFNSLNLHRAVNDAQKGIRPTRPAMFAGELVCDQQKDKLWSLIDTMWAHDSEIRPSASEIAEGASQLAKDLRLETAMVIPGGVSETPKKRVRSPSISSFSSTSSSTQKVSSLSSVI